jgi:hypothetical protein
MESINTKEIYEKKVYRGKLLTYLNIVAHSIEMVLLTFIALYDVSNSITPLSLEPNFTKVIWVIIILLQGTLAMLPIIYSDDDFLEILNDNIGINFAVVCVGITA